MRAYLPIRYSDLSGFLSTQSLAADRAYAPTASFIDENSDCNEEEIEYLLSILAGESALEIRTAKTSPGLVLAIELDDSQCGESYKDSIALSAPLRWDQVQCALLAHEGDAELIWFATQEIAQELDNWK